MRCNHDTCRATSTCTCSLQSANKETQCQNNIVFNVFLVSKFVQQSRANLSLFHWLNFSSYLLTLLVHQYRHMRWVTQILPMYPFLAKIGWYWAKFGQYSGKIFFFSVFFFFFACRNAPCRSSYMYHYPNTILEKNIIWGARCTSKKRVHELSPLLFRAGGEESGMRDQRVQKDFFFFFFYWIVV